MLVEYFSILLSSPFLFLPQKRNKKLPSDEILFQKFINYFLIFKTQLKTIHNIVFSFIQLNIFYENTLEISGISNNGEGI